MQKYEGKRRIWETYDKDRYEYLKKPRPSEED